MAVKARKFKRKLAAKPDRKKSKAILSVELVRKEYLEKVRRIWDKLISKTKGFKLSN